MTCKRHIPKLRGTLHRLKAGRVESDYYATLDSEILYSTANWANKKTRLM